mmetsp:Transcript_99177/g.259152  ORF Transcript_99177/g.259152 Transcript_99177/m.259152 type:complete len:261 (-) Transcript_99177:40-822(-)
MKKILRFGHTIRRMLISKRKTPSTTTSNITAPFPFHNGSFKVIRSADTMETEIRKRIKRSQSLAVWLKSGSSMTFHMLSKTIERCRLFTNSIRSFSCCFLSSLWLAVSLTSSSSRPMLTLFESTLMRGTAGSRDLRRPGSSEAGGESLALAKELPPPSTLAAAQTDFEVSSCLRMRELLCKPDHSSGGNMRIAETMVVRPGGDVGTSGTPKAAFNFASMDSNLHFTSLSSHIINTCVSRLTLPASVLIPSSNALSVPSAC